MFDRGLFLTAHAIRRQLAAMPQQLYLVRLIHHLSKRAFPGERLWTADQLTQLATIRFLRVRNREGCDVYLQPYAEGRNAGYIFVDLDRAQPTVLAQMRANGHQPCVVLQTSPGHLQAWIQVSPTPLEPDLATALGRHLARRYGGDRASTDWRHLGRLAGFTNQKPQRRSASGQAPWVRVLYAAAGLATHAAPLLQAARGLAARASDVPPSDLQLASVVPGDASPSRWITQAQEIYQSWVRRWHIAQRFVPPDWSIVDLWVARALLAQGMAPARVQDVLRLGSPQFPRGHRNPDDYLQRTLARAFPAFPARRRAPCAAHATTSTVPDRDCSNSTGGR